MKFISLTRIRRVGLLAILASGLSSDGATPITEGHVDIGIAYDDVLNAWDLHVHDEEHGVEYSPPTDALLVVKFESLTAIPPGAQWSFLGAAGDPVWILPKVQNPNLLFLGFGAEEIGAGVFQGDQLNMSLRSVTGPGSFTAYDTDAFGNPTVIMNSRDGITGADTTTLAAGAHQHLNWAFSAPGDYSVFFEASGVRASDMLFTTSGVVEYRFHVDSVPEPASVVLLGLGLLVAARVRRK